MPLPEPVVDAGPDDFRVGDLPPPPRETGVAPPSDAGPDTATEARLGSLFFVHASTAHDAVFVCFGAFLSTDDPTKKDAPIAAMGPFARSDLSGLRWGDALPIPVNEMMSVAFESFTVVVWTVSTNPSVAGKTCKETWSASRTDSTRYRVVTKGTVITARDVVVFGDADSPTPEIRLAKLMPPREPGDPAVEVIHWSGAPIGPVDLYLARDGSFVPLAKSATYGSVSPPAKLMMSIEESRFVIARPGSTPCTTSDGAPTDACPAWSLVLNPTNATLLGKAPANSLIWFGSPGVALHVVGIAHY